MKDNLQDCAGGVRGQGQGSVAGWLGPKTDVQVLISEPGTVSFFGNRVVADGIHLGILR